MNWLREFYEAKAEIASIQPKITEAKKELEAAEERYEKAIVEKQPTDIIGAYKTILNSDKSQLFGLLREKDRWMEMQLLYWEIVNEMAKRKTNDALMAYLEDRFTYDGNSTSASERPDFKPNLARDYLLVPEQQYRETPGLLCQILDVKLPKFLVSAFHVFKPKWAADSYYLLDFDDVVSSRNGLLLFQPIERAFNRSQLCFLKANREDSLFLRLLDPGLRDITLFDACLPLINEIDCASINKTVDEVLSALQITLTVNGRLLTFGDIEGNRIICKGKIRPYKRCLNFHAAVARRYALKQGWITHGVYTKFKWSQAFNKDDRIISHIDEIGTSFEAIKDENLENQLQDNILLTEYVDDRVVEDDDETDSNVS